LRQQQANLAGFHTCLSANRRKALCPIHYLVFPTVSLQRPRMCSRFHIPCPSRQHAMVTPFHGWRSVHGWLLQTLVASSKNMSSMSTRRMHHPLIQPRSKVGGASRCRRCAEDLKHRSTAFRSDKLRPLGLMIITRHSSCPALLLAMAVVAAMGFRVCDFLAPNTNDPNLDHWHRCKCC
jgi:hypothetical protein